MRIVIIEFISLDGVVQAPGGPEEDTDGGFAHGGWSHPFFDPEVVGGLHRCADQRRGPTVRTPHVADDGRGVADAIEHLRQAIDLWDGCRDMAEKDSDFDPIRNESSFQDLIGLAA